jgi:hypothetical protein
MAHFVFHTEPVAPIPLLLEAFAVASTVTLLAGFLANRGIVDHPPLEVLRQET